MPTPSPAVLTSRIQFKDNTEKNLITFQQEDLSWENGANFPTRQAGNASAGSFAIARSKERRADGHCGNRGVRSVLGMGHGSNVMTAPPTQLLSLTPT